MKINISHKLFKAVFIIPISFLIILISCRHVAYIESKAVIINRSFDVELKDSAVIYGRVYYAPDEKFVIPNANIWVEEINVKTVSNDLGFYNLKIPPGRYTIKCFTDYPNEEFTVILKDFTILGNEKVEINFLRGSRSE